MTKYHLPGLCIAVSPLLLLAGCAGTSNALLVSSTNVGIDIDTKPPQAEVSISRKELAVQPGFEGGETLPAVMSFSTKGDVNFLTKLFVGISSTFSTGRAAVALTSETGENGKSEDDDDVVVTKPPVAHRISDELRGRHRHLVGPGEMRPLVFGTKTIFGLHAAWDGAQYVPSELKVGFNRKEAAYAPVGYRVDSDGKHYVQVPSTLATLDNNSGSVKGGGSVGHTQYFATGRAATNMAKRQQIRDILIKRIEPATVLTPGTFSSKDGDLLVLIDTLHEAEPDKLNAASKEATGKPWSQIKRRGTPEQIQAIAAELRKQNLLK